MYIYIYTQCMGSPPVLLSTSVYSSSSVSENTPRLQVFSFPRQTSARHCPVYITTMMAPLNPLTKEHFLIYLHKSAVAITG